MNYVKSFDLFGVPAMQIPAAPGSGAPTTATEGAVGCLYMDTDTGNLYKCTSVADGVYTWVEAGNGSGGGLNETAASLLIGILRSVHIYDGDQSGKITALAAELGVTEEEEPDTPVEPDDPVTPEATLSSISATYSGGDVAVGTTVTDLTGIVVTAHYSDGSTATVTGYTLSGEIAEGSNTVTVSYGGKTTTFTVTGVDEESGPVSVEMVNKAGNIAVYSDAGTTSIFNSYTPYVVSVETFAEDTEVAISFNKTGTIMTRKAGACCVPSDASEPYTGHYGVELGTYSQLIDSPAKYTVKAGHKLMVYEHGTPTQGTFTVTKGA